MNNKQLIKISKFLSLVLRHKPETIGLQLDPQGWADIEELIAKSGQKGRSFDREILESVIENNDKKRFAISPDGNKIKANQGHSINIDLGLEPVAPPEFLYHGTPSRFLHDIWKSGLKKMSRHHVHLSQDRKTATKVGARRGVPVILIVKAGEMHQDGMEFFISENGVWLTDHVPVKYLERE